VPRLERSVEKGKVFIARRSRQLIGNEGAGYGVLSQGDSPLNSFWKLSLATKLAWEYMRIICARQTAGI